MKRLHSSTYISALTAMLLSVPAYALPDSQKLNLRESCRQAISGEYMSAFDGVKTSTAYLGEVEKMISRLEEAIVTEGKTLKTLRSKVERVTYDTQLSDQVIHQTEKVNALGSTLKLYQEQLGTAKEKILIVKNREVYLKAHIESVFNIIKGKGAGKSYPTALEFKAECPKYRHMCALPLSYHDALERILLRDDAAEVCKRYINFSKSGRR